MLKADFRIIIIGAGFGGLGTAIRLKQQGIEDFAILERGSEIGGVWRDNTYPGAACDVQSHLYSYSFAPNPNWSRMFSRQPEILDYLRDCAEKFGIRPFIRLRHEVSELTWDEPGKRWRVSTSQGELTARVLVVATGGLSEPLIPKLPGMERFQGKAMHSARWDHDYRLEGRRVAVIGTGASAVQFVPRIQPLVARLHVFQRTPHWVFPHTDRPISEAERRRFRRFPQLQEVSRQGIFTVKELEGLAFRNPRIMKLGEKIALAHLRKAIADPELRKKLTPRYTMGCKRILPSNDYYPALAQGNVELVTDPIQELREHSIVTRDGVERPIEALIFATGFQATELPFSRFVRGRDGRTLAEIWDGSPRGYWGTAISGFPNFFTITGPNTGLGHNSMILIMESQIEHILGALRHMEEHRVLALEPTASAEDQFNQEIDQRMKSTVWSVGGCQSWYIDRKGRNSVLWPGSVPEYRKRVGAFSPKDYEART